MPALHRHGGHAVVGLSAAAHHQPAKCRDVYKRQGLDGARALAKQHNDAAMAALDGFGAQEDFLRLLAGELLQRKK